jgi:beta-barrel assembly-enhancing protease
VNGPTHFQGGLFSDEVQGGRAGARIHPGFNGVEAETPEGRRFLVPYSDCVLEQGGASGKMIFCHTPDRRLTLYCEEKGFAEALARAGGRRIEAELERLRAAARKESRNDWLLFAGIMAVLLLLGAGAFRLLKVGASRAVHALPVSVDQKVGELAMGAIPLGGTKVEDPVLRAAMEQIVSRLEPHARLRGLDFQVTVVDSPTVNAFCLPGGRIVVYTGLLKAARNPEQVAGVLAHEMAHATLRHGLERITQSAGAVVAIELLLEDVSGLLALVVELARHGTLTSYGREQETAADMEGAEMMVKAGLDPAALADFFGILKEEHGELPDSLTWLASHPQLSERQAELRRKAEQSRPLAPKPLELDWAEVVRRAERPQAQPAVDSAPQTEEHAEPAASP